MQSTEQGRIRFAPSIPESIPALDGLRGISILLVLIGHLAGTVGMPAMFDKPYISSLGNVGVRVFFVISGLLITTLLLREWDRNGTISLKNFYIRRSIRILPAFFFFVFVMWLCHQIGLIDLSFETSTKARGQSADWHFLRAITFTYNYVQNYTWHYNHTWSLSVEEQFYLIWPFVLLFLGAHRAWKVLLFVVIVTPLIRYVTLEAFNTTHTALSRQFQCVMDALACGCLSAVGYNWISSKYLLEKMVRRYGIAIGILVVGLSYSVGFFSKDLAYVISPTFANLGIAIAIQACIRAPTSGLASFLRLSWLTWLGTLSYSIYLWQQPFLFFMSDQWYCRFPLNIFLAIVAGVMSHYCIEKPFLKLRSRFR